MSLLRKCQSALESVSSEWCFCAGAAAGAIFAPAALFLCLFLPRSRALWVAVGTMLVLGFKFMPLLWSPPAFETFFNGRAATVRYEIRLEDLRLSEAPGLDAPAVVRAKLIRFKFDHPDEKEHICSGNVMVFSNYPLPRRYGAILSGKGALIPPDPGRPHPSWLLRADNWELKGFQNSWRSCVLKIRDKLLERLCSSIKDDTARNLAAAFYLGTTGGMSPERRRDFIAAGTVHLFAVSGLHVGMAALLLLLILRTLPFRFRCFTAAAGVWGYVLLTGAALPALRAGVMIGLFLICRGMLFHTPPLRLMGVAAGVIIIAEPDALSSVGFHYSFLITAVLLLLSERLQEWRQLEGRLFTIMPCTPGNLFRRRLFNWGFSLKSAVISGIVAVLAGSVVSLYHNLALTPGAVAANWFTMPVLGFLFAMLPVKLLLSFTTPELDRFGAQVIEGIFSYLRAISAIASELAAPFYACAPGIILSGLMVILLLLTLRLRNARIACLSGIAFLLLFLSVPLYSHFSSSRVTVISSDSYRPPTVVISDKGLNEVFVVNPVRDHSLHMEEALKRAGTAKIKEVAFSAPQVRNMNGLLQMALRYPVERVIMPPLTGRNWQFKDRITESNGSYSYAEEGNGMGILRLFREKNKFAIEYPDSGVMLDWRLEISNCDRGREIKFIRQGKEVRYLLPWSNKNGVWQHEW